MEFVSRLLHNISGLINNDTEEILPTTIKSHLQNTYDPTTTTSNVDMFFNQQENSGDNTTINMMDEIIHKQQKQSTHSRRQQQQHIVSNKKRVLFKFVKPYSKLPPDSEDVVWMPRAGVYVIKDNLTVDQYDNDDDSRIAEKTIMMMGVEDALKDDDHHHIEKEIKDSETEDEVSESELITIDLENGDDDHVINKTSGVASDEEEEDDDDEFEYSTIAHKSTALFKFASSFQTYVSDRNALIQKFEVPGIDIMSESFCDSTSVNCDYYFNVKNGQRIETQYFWIDPVAVHSFNIIEATELARGQTIAALSSGFYKLPGWAQEILSRHNMSLAVQGQFNLESNALMAMTFCKRLCDEIEEVGFPELKNNKEKYNVLCSQFRRYLEEYEKCCIQRFSVNSDSKKSISDYIRMEKNRRSTKSSATMAAASTSSINSDTNTNDLKPVSITSSSSLSTTQTTTTMFSPPPKNMKITKQSDNKKKHCVINK